VVTACASHHDTAGDFGGQPKDQAARERHHPQYPESAQNLGPQEQTTHESESRQSEEMTEQERAAVSGVGK
jgi:hypothetical protein